MKSLISQTRNVKSTILTLLLSCLRSFFFFLLLFSRSFESLSSSLFEFFCFWSNGLLSFSFWIRARSSLGNRCWKLSRVKKSWRNSCEHVGLSLASSRKHCCHVMNAFAYNIQMRCWRHNQTANQWVDYVTWLIWWKQLNTIEVSKE